MINFFITPKCTQMGSIPDINKIRKNSITEYNQFIWGTAMDNQNGINMVSGILRASTSLYIGHNFGQSIEITH